MISGTWWKGKWVRLLSDALTGLLMLAAIVVIGMAIYRHFGGNADPVASDRELREGELTALEPSMLRPVPEGALAVVVFSDYQCPFCKVAHDSLMGDRKSVV